MMFFLRSRLAIDLGSYKIRIAEYETDTFIDEVHALMIKPDTGQAMQIGDEIEELNRKVLAEEFGIIWPMHNGMIDDDLSCKFIIAYHRRKLSRWARFIKPITIASVPVSSTYLGRKTVQTIISESVRAKETHLVEDVLAAAIGADVDSWSDDYYFMLLIGAGVSSIGVVKRAGIRFRKQILYAGNWLDVAIQRHLYQTKGVWIGLDSCRQIKHEVGTLAERSSSKIWRKKVWHEDRSSSMLSLTAEDIKPALEKGLAPLVEELYWFFQELPDEVRMTIQKKGILLGGGTAYLPHLHEWLAHELKYPVNLAAEPDLLVVKGMKIILNHFENINHDPTPRNRIIEGRNGVTLTDEKMDELLKHYYSE